MDVKEAVQTAKEYLRELFDDEQISDVGLEEVEFDVSDKWKITIGFSRYWNKNNLPAVLSAAGTPRSYKVVCINNKNGRVESLTDRQLQASK